MAEVGSIMQTWSKSILSLKIAPYFLFLVGIFIDIIVNITGKSKFYVSESYMDYIYAGIITISVLCFSFVALLSGFLDKTYYGYKLCEIIQFPNSLLNMKKYIAISLSTIVIGTFLLAGNFVKSCANTLTALLLALVLEEGIIAFNVIDMLINPKKIFEIVIKYFSDCVENKEMNFEEFRFHTDKLISALTICISQKDISQKNNVCNMLNKLSKHICIHKGTDEYDKFYFYLIDKIRVKIESFTLAFGYNEMISFICSLYDQLDAPEFEYDKSDLFIIPLKKLRFWDDLQLLNNDYFDQIKDIDMLELYKTMQIKNVEMEKILFVYFQSITNNRILSQTVKGNLLKKYIGHFMRFNWMTNEPEYALDIAVLTNILNTYILKSTNTEQRNYIFHLILEYAFYNQTYNNDKFSYFLTLFYQSFYAYIFCETETLTPEYRSELRNTFEQNFSSESIADINTVSLLTINIISFLQAMGKRLTNSIALQKRIFEYYPPYASAKTVVWTDKFDIEYFFILYIIFYDKIEFYDIYSDFLPLQNIDGIKKEQILLNLQNCFDSTTELLDSNFYNACKEYSSILKKVICIDKIKQKELFHNIVAEHAKLKIQLSDSKQNNKLELEDSIVTKLIDELMEKEHIYGWDSSFMTSSSMQFNIPDSLCRREHANSKTMARSIQLGIISALKKYISNTATQLSLSTDLGGIEKLLDFLKLNDYNATNFTYTDYLKKQQSTPDFAKLQYEENNLELIHTPQFYENILFKKEKFTYNAKISTMEFLELTDLDCIHLLENSECYNGLYNVDGALMPKYQAIECMKKIYCKQHCSFKLMVKMGRNDIAHIIFNRFN